MAFTFLSWSHLTSHHFTLSHKLPYLTSHVTTSDPTLHHIILKLAMNFIITPTNKKLFNKANFVNRRTYERTHLSTKRGTEQVGQCTIITLSSLYHPLINFHTLARFWKRQVPIGACCIQIVIRIIGVIRNPPPSQSMAQQNGTKVLQCMSLHHVIASYSIHQSFRVLKQHLWDSCPLHLSSARSSRRCE